MSRFVFSVLLLTLVYALTLASFAPWDLALGVLLAAGMLLLFRRFLFPDGASRGGEPGLLMEWFDGVAPWLADALIVLGVAVMTVGVFGMIRMPDLSTKLHAAGEAPQATRTAPQ